MMGMQTAPAQLFYDFCLDDHIPEGHLLRRIDRFLDLEKVRTELKPFYSSIGRPSIDPELMMRMLIVGYCMGIRSERRLCEEIHLNPAYRWFCRLGLEDSVPVASTSYSAPIRIVASTIRDAGRITAPGGPNPLLAANVKRPAVEFREPPRKWQSEPGALMPPRVASVDLTKGFEGNFDFLRCHPQTAIPHLKFDRAVADLVTGCVCLAARVRELDSVGYQIQQH